MKQKTVKSNVSFKGAGLHTGIECNLTIKPSTENTGIVFVRVDVTNQNNKIPALAKYVINTSRCTKIGINEEVSVSTIEHLMATFNGLGINNAIVEIDGPEVPIMDGSSKVFVEKIIQVGVREQEAENTPIKLDQVISVRDEESGSELIAIPNDEFSLDVFVDFNLEKFRPQLARLDSIENFCDQIYDCRTFCFLHEIEHLSKQNLIKGGSLKNAIVYVDREISDETKRLFSEHIFESDDIKVNEHGVLNNVELKYSNEAARHKLLDVIGDLFLLGNRINAKIIARKPGHKINIELAKKILLHLEKNRDFYDIESKPVKDVREILSILPHRFPFLLIDKIIELTDSRVVGIKNVTIDEPFFQGHFSENPVLPGVLQLEAMAQAGGIFALKTVPDPENYSTYFLKIDKVKFKKKVVPGDVMVLVLDLINPIKMGIVSMRANAYVNRELVTQAELSALITKEKNI